MIRRAYRAASSMDPDQLREQARQIMASYSPQPLTTQHVEVVFQGEQLQVWQHTVHNHVTGTTADCIKINYPQSGQFGVLVVPMLPDGRIVLSLQFVCAAERWTLELPRLHAQDGDQGWLPAARQCLAETSGMTSDKWSILGNLYLEPDLASVSLLAVLAEQCQSTGFPAQAVSRVIGGNIFATPTKLDELIRGGDVESAPTLAAVAMLRARQAR